MRIALVTAGLPFGGTTTFCLFLGAGLKKLGIPVEVFSFTTDHPMEGEFHELGVAVHTMDERRHIFEDRLQAIYNSLREFQPTAVFAVLGAESFEVLRYMPEGVLRVGMVHDHYQIVYDLIARYQPFLDHAAAVSRHIHNHLSAQFPDIPCSYLQHGVLLKDQNALREPNPGGPLKLLFFGRFDNLQKQIFIFPEIHRILTQNQVSFRWTFHGRGPDEAALRSRFATAIQAGTVVFSEPVHHGLLHQIIRRHDVYTLASLHEAGPLTLVEAMGQGLVPVCGDIPCLVQEMIEPGVNGFRVKVDEPESYAGLITTLCKDRQLLEAVSSRARATVEAGFSAEAMAARYVRFVSGSAPAFQNSAWPARINIKPLMNTTGLFQSPGPARWLRRLAKSVRS